MLKRVALLVNPRPLLFALASIALLFGNAAPSPAATPQLESDSVWETMNSTALAPRVHREIDRYSGSSEYDRARTDPRFAFRRWTYRSDSARVVAFVCRPVADRDRVKRPAVVFCRGSYIQDSVSAGQLPVFYRLAAAGFVAAAPQYRGSEGGKGRDEMGGADVRDVTALVEILAHDPGVDPRAIYLYGESRGGMMAYQAVRDRARVRAIATVGAFTDLDSLLARDPRSAAAAGQIWPDWASRRKEIADRRSAMRWPGQIRVPTLILFGQNDDRVGPAAGEQLARAHRAQGTECEFRVLEGAGHVIGERSKLRDSLVVDWFRRHRP